MVVVSSANGELHGRMDEIAFATELITQAQAGNGNVATIIGEPGIGKTALLSLLRNEAAHRGFRVLAGAATHLDKHVSFAGLRACFEGHIGPHELLIDRVLTLLSGAERAEGGLLGRELAITESLLALMDHWCAAAPVAVIVDDVQWADGSTMKVLQHLSRYAVQQPVLLLIATRRSQLPTVLAELDSSGGHHIELAPLSEPAVVAMVAQTLERAPEPVELAAVARAGGNPLYVTEILAGIMPTSTLPTVRQPPNSPEDVIEARLALLPATARQVLSVASVLVPNIATTELAEVLDAPAGHIDSVVKLALEAGLLAGTPERFTFRHDLIQQVLAERVPQATQRNLHDRAALILAANEASPERVAGHLVQAAYHMVNPTMETWLLDNMSGLALRAPELAADLIERTLPRVSRASNTYRALWEHYIRALLTKGSSSEAEASIRALLRSNEPLEQLPSFTAVLWWLLTMACIGQGKLDETISTIRQVTERHVLTESELSRYTGLASICHYLLGRLEPAEFAAKDAFTHGDFGNHGAVTLGSLAYVSGRLDEALSYGKLVVHGYQTQPLDDKSDQFDPYTLQGNSLTELDRYPEALHLHGVAMLHGYQHQGTFIASSLYARARIHFLTGNWDDSLAEIEACADTPDPMDFGPTGLALADLIAVRRGSPAARPCSPTEGFGDRDRKPWQAWTHALLLERDGKLEHAQQVLAEICSQTLGVPTLYYLFPDLARLAFTCDNNALSHEIAAKAELLAEISTPTHSRRGTALYCRGLADSRRDLLDAAADAFRSAGRPLYEALAREALAAALAADGHRTDARKSLVTAIANYQRLDAYWDMARAESTLRKHGVRLGQVGPRNRPKTGWASLTPTEHRVAKLVAEGHSNAAIGTQMVLSRRTVQSHVSSILTKLAAQSRVQIAIEFHRQR